VKPAEVIVVRQTRTHQIFFLAMAFVLAGAGVLVVQRPLQEAYPAGLSILAVFSVVGLHIFTSRLELDGPILSAFRFGRMLWSIDVRQARFRATKDDVRWLVIDVLAEGRKIGSIHEIYFDQDAFKRLWVRIGEP
jgi:hypothetical protein